MDFYSLLKLAAVVVALLIILSFIVNAVLSFIVRFSEQLRKFSKNILIVAGAAYLFGLVFFREETLVFSLPLIFNISKVFPDFFTF